MSQLKIVESRDFSTTIASGTVLVDFGAPWCAPCKALEPLLCRLGDEFEGRLSIVKVDVDATPDLAEQCGIMSVPALMLFKDGKRVAGRTGPQTLDQLRTFVQPVL
ncbi:thioredoxin [Geothrix limicola]|uniref:Thioredoxin n=1 Tax=Geothrix limicola TaxID=2927978 RepID=A0ABQ5QF27_9BACT|nr:thioredoxin family protein [Geothrix limicola]GLH73450.1 thioredoxin [Geothrix limicola]